MRKKLSLCLLWAIFAPVIFVVVCAQYVRAFGEPRGAAEMLIVVFLASAFVGALTVGSLRGR